MNLPNSNPLTEKIKAAIHQHLQKVRTAGPNDIVSLCPFHQDRSPSFSMNVHSGLYICYACGQKGNFRQFLEKVAEMSPRDIQVHYGQTLKQLSNNAPPPPDPTKVEAVSEVNARLPEDLLGLFHRCPLDLVAEGFDEATLLEFGVGVDSTHERITYPLRDLEGHLVGISGRAMRDDQNERYKVYRIEYKDWGLPIHETDKSLLLWNAHRVYPTIYGSPKAQPVVIVEGFKACMWLKQAGVSNVVALMTKRMSWTQQKILERMGGPYILMLDNNEAGIEGTKAVSAALRRTGGEVRFVEYDVEQPSDIPREDVLKLLETTVSYFEITH